MKKNILYYSDCHFFAGCENMLVSFFNNGDLKEKYNINFIYRNSQRYTEGFRKRVPETDVNVIPVNMPDPNLHFLEVKHYKNKFIDFIRTIIVGLITIFLRYLFVFYDTFVLYQIFKKIKTDILHINNGGYPAAYSTMSAVFAAKLCGIKHIVYMVNNIAVPYSKPSRWLDILLDKFVTKNVDFFITASIYAGKELKQVLSLPNNKIVNIHNGIRPRSVTETPEEVFARLKVGDISNRALFAIVALMEKRKGHIYLLQAINQLKNDPSLKKKPLVFIEGDGPEFKTLKDYTDEHQLNDYIVFTGDENNIFNLMNSIDVLVHPSFADEDFLNIVSEAMSLSKAVIGSNFAGIPEQIVHMESGILVEPKNHIQLAEMIKLVCNDNDLIKRLGTNASKRFRENFSAEISVRKYLELYDKIIKKSP